MWNKRTTTISKIKLRNIYLICTTVHNVGDNIMNSLGENLTSKLGGKNAKETLHNIKKERENLLEVVKTSNKNVLTVQVPIEGTSIISNKHIEYLDNLEKQNLIEWKN